MDNQLTQNLIKYLAYSRKSSEAEEKQEKSIVSQKNEIKERFCNLNIVGWFEEEKSAFKPYNRPIFSEMLRRIEAGEAEGLIAWHPDRTARNAVDAGQIIYLLDTGKLKDLKFVSYPFENTPEGKMFLGMTMSQSKYYSEKLGRDTKRGLKTKLESGGPIGVVPQGYLNDRVNKTAIKDPDRLPLIRQCWELLLYQKVAVRTILKTLNEDWGFRTKRVGKWGGKPLSLSGLYAIFNNRFYCGWKDLKDGRSYKLNHEPMLTDQEFYLAQKRLKDKGKAKPQTHEFAFTGLIRCGECGCLVTAEEKFNRYGSFYTYYHCTKKKREVQCSQKTIEVRRLEMQIDDYLSRITISERFKDWAIKYLNEANDQEVEVRNASLQSTHSAYEDVVKILDNLLTLKISPQNSDGGLLSDEEYASRKIVLMKEKIELEEKLKDTGQRVNRWLELAENAFNFACYAKYHFEHGTLHEKRLIFEGLGSNFSLKDGKLTINAKKPFQLIENLSEAGREKLTGLEPAEILAATRKNGALDPVCSVWLPGQDSNLRRSA